MVIKGMNGESYNVTGSGQGVYNTVSGSAGLASFFGVNARNLLNGLGGGNQPVEVITSDDKPISRYEAKMMQELAAKDGKIALLEANEYSNQKDAEVYRVLRGEIKELATEVRNNKAAQDEVNMQQAVYNGTNNATLSCIQNQVAQLASLSQLVVPQRNVCSTGCCCNG